MKPPDYLLLRRWEGTIPNKNISNWVDDAHRLWFSTSYHSVEILVRQHFVQMSLLLSNQNSIGHCDFPCFGRDHSLREGRCMRERRAAP